MTKNDYRGIVVVGECRGTQKEQGKGDGAKPVRRVMLEVDRRGRPDIITFKDAMPGGEYEFRKGEIYRVQAEFSTFNGVVYWTIVGLDKDCDTPVRGAVAGVGNKLGG